MAGQNEIDEYKKSWILYHVMNNWIGSEELMEIRRKGVILKDLGINTEKQLSFCMFSTGSTSEGISMKGSDSDVMTILKDVVVLCRDQRDNTYMSNNRDDMSVLRAKHTDSRPGYVALKLVYLGRGCPSELIKSIVPVHDQFFISSEEYRRAYTDIIKRLSKADFKMHGPASTFTGEKRKFANEVDCVQAFRYPYWPKEALEWVIRPRPNGWPNEALREEIVNDGCYLVPVGDKTSAYTFLQWRISLATAERKLVYSLTHVQFLVYCLLKYFLKQISDILSQLLGDTDILSSYIMKTVIFYAVEKTPDTLWQEKHTFLCFMLCLNILITWVKAGYCPNYFIRNNNMFLGKVYGENQQKLLCFLIDLHDMKWGCLSVGTFIEPTIGYCVGRAISGYWKNLQKLPSKLERKQDMEILNATKQCAAVSVLDTLPDSLTLMCKSTSDLDEFIYYILTINGLSNAAQDEFDGYMSHRKNKEKYKSLRKRMVLLAPNASVCSSPGKLELASFYYQTGNYRNTLCMCGHMTSSFKLYAYAAINEQKKYEHMYCCHGYTILKKYQEAFASPLYVLQKYSRFHPLKLLQITKLLRGCFLLIPPLPYALFLTFLCYHEIGDTKRRDAALVDLRSVKYDENQGGDEYWVVHNMLGICYEIVGDNQRALREYREFLTVETFDQYCNPAKEMIKRLQQSPY
ncbi:uncharacterized protein [Argopecten irradians]|uniref:uncharacterized protein n=1 Tax=Argopecten irradians TaxID=31199 RepID=UPI003714D945